MTAAFVENDRFPIVFAVAHGMTDTEVGTEHLLNGLISAVPEIAALLDAFDITKVVVRSVIEDRAGRWEDEHCEPVDVVIAAGGEPTPFSATAAAALARCTQRGSGTPVDVLTAILEDPRSRAATVLRDCGADLEDIRQALRTGHAPPREDRLPPALRPTRDLLIGRQRYRGRGWRNFLLAFIVRVRINYAATPVLWASLEADEIARRRGGPRLTDDLLVAMLATYEVTVAYPHLARKVPEQYDGSRTLAAAGLTHARLAEAVAGADLGTDEVPATSLVPRGTPWPEDTAALLHLLITHRGNRSARLLTALGVSGPAPQ